MKSVFEVINKCLWLKEFRFPQLKWKWIMTLCQFLWIRIDIRMWVKEKVRDTIRSEASMSKNKILSELMIHCFPIQTKWQSFQKCEHHRNNSTSSLQILINRDLHVCSSISEKFQSLKTNAASLIRDGSRCSHRILDVLTDKPKYFQLSKFSCCP